MGPGGYEALAWRRLAKEMRQLDPELGIVGQIEDDQLGVELPHRPKLVLPEGRERRRDLYRRRRPSFVREEHILDHLPKGTIGRDQRSADGPLGHRYLAIMF